MPAPHPSPHPAPDQRDDSATTNQRDGATARGTAARAFRRVDPATTETRDLHQYMVGLIGPRPIAFVSTVDDTGHANVAPYSFFNAFSSNPPIVVFSSNRRVTDNTTKDTLANVRATGECVINVVNHAILHQMALASVEWPAEVSEFDIAGFTRVASEQVRPPRVAESPAALECRVRDIITLGEAGGAGHLIVCDVLLIHVDETVLDDRNRIDPHRLDLMGRLGRSFYVRASGEAVFPVVQPRLASVIGWPALPRHIRESPVLTGNELAQLAGAERVPTAEELAAATSTDDSSSGEQPAASAKTPHDRGENQQTASAKTLHDGKEEQQTASAKTPHDGGENQQAASAKTDSDAVQRRPASAAASDSDLGYTPDRRAQHLRIRDLLAGGQPWEATVVAFR